MNTIEDNIKAREDIAIEIRKLQDTRYVLNNRIAQQRYYAKNIKK